MAKEALANNPIDAGEIYLAGYSNGAIAVTRAATREPGLFKGLIYLSPVTEDDLFDAPAVLDQYRGRRLLFLHGGQDKRIASSFVQGTVAVRQRNGVHADLHVYEQEDHFLLFSQTDAVIAEMAEYMAHDKERKVSRGQGDSADPRDHREEDEKPAGVRESFRGMLHEHSPAVGHFEVPRERESTMLWPSHFVLSDCRQRTTWF